MNQDTQNYKDLLVWQKGIVLRRSRTRGRVVLLVCCVFILVGFAVVAGVDILYIT